jgi:ribosome biogenesis protein Nip4
MIEDLVGCFARSLAGHDKCTVYVIICADNEYVYLSDGKNKSVDSPKKKKRKHIQIINKKDETIESKHVNGIHIMNEDIKRAIKIYISNI